MLNRIAVLVASGLCLCISMLGQEASSGVSVPVTISGALRLTHELGETTSVNPGFRVVASPTISLGTHWFAYSALEAHSSSYFQYRTGKENTSPVQVNVMQAFVGYLRTSSKGSVMIKAGQISSEFGLFPADYEDSKMPLINPPLVYMTNLPLRPDQLPCGTPDVLSQEYDSAVAFRCGGSAQQRYGATPVTLYGLPSIESQISVARFDARLQVSNSSPVNPHGLTSNSQFAQWTAGGGYTTRQGLHVGMSGFKGPYLDENLVPLLSAGTNLRSFSASGIEADARWSRGPWSGQAEWLHFSFALPGFAISPSESAAYAEMKLILSPRVFVAARLNTETFGGMKDQAGLTASKAAGPQQVYEFGLGYRLNRQQLLKTEAAWSRRDEWISMGWFWPRVDTYRCQVQLVTSFTGISKAFQ